MNSTFVKGDIVIAVIDNSLLTITNVLYDYKSKTYFYTVEGQPDELYTESDFIKVSNVDFPDKTLYNTRTWLNSTESPFTGSIVCYDGVTDYNEGVSRNCFIEMSDCHNKARIHKGWADSMGNYIQKVETLYNNIGDYLNHLKNIK